MNQIFNLAAQMYREIRDVGVFGFFRFYLSARGQRFKVSIGGVDLTVRARSHDLQVARSTILTEYSLLEKFFPRDYEGYIVDAGGYIGSAALALRKLYPKAKLVVIEPSKENLEVLRGNLANLQDIEIIEGALTSSSMASEVSLFSRNSGEWGYTVVETPRDIASPDLLHRVKTFTLDEVLSPSIERGLIKLDIEGGEYDLLRNDHEALGRFKAVFVELHDRIVPGCSDAFFKFSESRRIIKSSGEKFLSVR